MVFLLFGFGLIIGSFLNVVILRYHPDRSLFSFAPITGRSHCMSCGKTLSWYELIPLFSFLIQKGKCRTCGNRLSRQYPIVEFLSGLIFLTPMYFYDGGQMSIIIGAFWTLIFLSFLVLAAIDYHWYIIPDELNLMIAGLGLAKTAFDGKFGYFGEFSGSFAQNYSALFGLRSDVWINHFAGVLAGFFVIGLIIFLTKGRGMGMGDLKLIAALGILFGWPDVIFLLAFGFIIGAIFSLNLIFLGTKGMKDSVPFGPFLVLGAMMLVFFGEAILDWYFGIFI